MNSDWEKLRRFAMQLFPAGYAERWCAKRSLVLLGAEMFLYEASNTEKPCAGKPHAGICEGAVG